MTVKLYDADSHLTDFTATVLACTPIGSGYETVLDQTAFFPNEGGQYADTGTLGGAAVSDVQLRGDILYHLTDRPLAVGERVSGHINWPERLRKMQNHTGEHIVSGLVFRRFGFNNVGFHLGSDDVTLDFDGELTREQLDEIESLANTAVAECAPVEARYPSAEELATLEYRSKLELTENVRIVTVKGYDCCACCAPHVSNCGEIGLIKLLDFARYKGGVRIHMQCGFDALDDYRDKYSAVSHIAETLSAKQNETAAAFDRLMEEYDRRAREIASLRRRLVAAKVEAVRPTDGDAVIFDGDLDSQLLRMLCDGVADRCGGVAYAFSGNGSQYAFVIASRTVDVRPVCRSLTEALGGRGGGRPTMVQGTLNADQSQIRCFLAANALTDK